MNSISCILLASSYVLTSVFGAYYCCARGCGACLSCLLGCFSLVSIITGFILRYHTIGKLTALSEGPSYYDTDTEKFTTYRTYASDAEQLTTLLIVQLCLCCASCLAGCFFGRKPKPVIEVPEVTGIESVHHEVAHDLDQAQPLVVN